MRTNVKVCGIKSLEDANLVIEAGAKLIGFIFAESSRQIIPKEAARISKELPKEIEKVGVFVNQSTDKIRDIADFCSLDTLQIYNWPGLKVEFIRKYKTIQVYRITDQVDIINAYTSPADLILFDTYKKDRYGGTGVSFNWEMLKEVNFERDYFLAGGINPENVFQVVVNIRPFGIDVASGLEINPGKKDPERVNQFFTQVKKAEEYLETINE